MRPFHTVMAAQSIITNRIVEVFKFSDKLRGAESHSNLKYFLKGGGETRSGLLTTHHLLFGSLYNVWLAW
jgi:hypothetical protein